MILTEVKCYAPPNITDRKQIQLKESPVSINPLWYVSASVNTLPEVWSTNLTLVTTRNNSFHVRESPKEIENKILEQFPILAEFMRVEDD